MSVSLKKVVRELFCVQILLTEAAQASSDKDDQLRLSEAIVMASHCLHLHGIEGGQPESRIKTGLRCAIR